MEATFIVQTGVVPAILATSGQVLGVAFRPIVVTGVPLPLAVEAELIHLRLPAAAVQPGLEQWSHVSDMGCWPTG